MVRFLIRTAVFLGSAAIGVLVANLVLDDFRLDAGSFVIDVVIFAVLQAILAPFIAKTAMRNAPAVLGAAGLITTFLALLITSIVSSGLVIDGFDTWIFATLIVWIATMLATLLLPLLLGKRVAGEMRDRRAV